MRAEGGGIALLPAHRRRLPSAKPRRWSTPTGTSAMPSPDTASPEPEAWLVLIAGDTDRAVLFRRPHNDRGINSGKASASAPDVTPPRRYFGRRRPLPHRRTLDELVPALMRWTTPRHYALLAGDKPYRIECRSRRSAGRGVGKEPRRPVKAAEPVCRTCHHSLARCGRSRTPTEIADQMRRAAQDRSEGAHAQAMRVACAARHCASTRSKPN